MAKLKRVKVVTDGRVAQVTGYTYSSRGKDVLIGAVACNLVDLREVLLAPPNQARLGLDLQRSLEIPGVLRSER